MTNSITQNIIIFKGVPCTTVIIDGKHILWDLRKGKDCSYTEEETKAVCPNCGTESKNNSTINYCPKCEESFMKKHMCRVKKEFVLKNPEHGRDHANLILTKNSSDIFWYRKQDGRIQLMMEFYHGHKKYDPKNYMVYKVNIGDVSYEEFLTHFDVY